MYSKEPVFNLKCIVFTILLAVGYWFLPRRNKWVLLMLALIPYFIISFYDKYYVCHEKRFFIAKIVAFTAFLMVGYWYLPHHNKWVLLALLYFPYLVLAWYDYYFVCERNMGPTYLSLFYWWAKPKESQQIKDYNNWDPVIKRKVLMVDMFILVVAVLCVPSFLKWKPT